MCLNTLRKRKNTRNVQIMDSFDKPNSKHGDSVNGKDFDLLKICYILMMYGSGHVKQKMHVF